MRSRLKAKQILIALALVVLLLTGQPRPAAAQLFATPTPRPDWCAYIDLRDGLYTFNGIATYEIAGINYAAYDDAMQIPGSGVTNFGPGGVVYFSVSNTANVSISSATVTFTTAPGVSSPTEIDLQSNVFGTVHEGENSDLLTIDPGVSPTGEIQIDAVNAGEQGPQMEMSFQAGSQVYMTQIVLYGYGAYPFSTFSLSGGTPIPCDQATPTPTPNGSATSTPLPSPTAIPVTATHTSSPTPSNTSTPSETPTQTNTPTTSPLDCPVMYDFSDGDPGVTFFASVNPSGLVDHGIVAGEYKVTHLSGTGGATGGFIYDFGRAVTIRRVRFRIYVDLPSDVGAHATQNEGANPAAYPVLVTHYGPAYATWDSDNYGFAGGSFEEVAFTFSANDTPSYEARWAWFEITVACSDLPPTSTATATRTQTPSRTPSRTPDFTRTDVMIGTPPATRTPIATVASATPSSTAVPSATQTLYPFPTAIPTVGVGDPGDEDNGEINILNAIGEFFAWVTNTANNVLDWFISGFNWIRGTAGNLVTQLENILAQLRAQIDLLQALWADIIAIGNLLIAIVNHLIDLSLRWIDQMTNVIRFLINDWQDAAPTPIPFLPHCVTMPLQSSVCALYYMLRYTIFDGFLGGLILPVFVVIVDILLVLYFVTAVRGLLRSIRSMMS